jgi:hypothetical protein
MTIAFSVPFWLILIILVVIGIIGFMIIADKAGDYDFFTPFLALGFALVFIVLAIGLALGKWVF